MAGGRGYSCRSLDNSPVTRHLLQTLSAIKEPPARTSGIFIDPWMVAAGAVEGTGGLLS